MKYNKKFAIAVVLPLALAACGGEIERSRSLQPTGSAFDTALFQGYMSRAEHENGYGHYQSSDAFAVKARLAASGQSVEPFTPNDDAYPSGLVPEGDLFAMRSGRQALVEVLAATARTKAPQDAADAQVNFDCWVEEQSYINNFFEDNQPDHAQACRVAFEGALARAQAAVKPVPAPAPEPEPEPVVAIPSNYLVFFDWDSADLTEQARQIVTEAAANYEKDEFEGIQVVGHADTSGPAAYNTVLSRERALNVIETLVLQGIQEQDIEILWKGETEPLVSTGDGVREPQNRRAEIVFK
jgi:outer membrane protein OmpA-like peptidoglycan-associated protein